LDFSFQLLLAHERLHFFAEYAASRLELVTGNSSYSEYFKAPDAARHEEALANAHSMKIIRRNASKQLTAAAEQWMLTQPEGYRDFKHWLPPNFGQGQRQAVKFMSLARAVAARLSANSYPAEFVFSRIAPSPCPVYIVLDSKFPWLRGAKPFPAQFGLQLHVHTNDHRPVHIHIDCPPGRPYTRYLWPDLAPFPKDARLRSSDEKALRQYVDVHRSAIERKIAAVLWQ
jgi:hypothetical protein